MFRFKVMFMSGFAISAVKINKRIKKRLSVYIFVLPALLIFVFVILVPTVSGFYYSFTNLSGMTSVFRWVGFDNYRRLFADRVFYIAIKNTVVLTVVIVCFQNSFGLFLAVLLNSKIIPGRNMFRAIFFIPSLLSIVVIGYTWLYLLNVHVGLFGMILNALKVKNIVRFDVFLQPILALLTVAGTIVWQFSGYNMVIYLSGLQSISHEIYESADIDGAGIFRKFLRITLPLIMPSVTINVFLNTISCLKIFEQIYVMTRGGPGSTTETIGTFLYNSAFSSSQMGYGSAIATILFFGILVISLFLLPFLRAKEVQL
jgi:raffinose/stachyose/melibiose transport system permease protein